MDRAEFFDAAAAGWDARANADTLPRLHEFVARAAPPRGGRVLDVGTGAGVLLPLLQEAVGPDGEIMAVDISAAMLAEAERRHGAPNVRFLQADAANIPAPDDYFDLVMCNAVAPHFDDLARTLRRLADLLVVGGTLVVCHAVPRARVNAIHQAGPPAISHDELPPAEQMAAAFATAGLRVAACEDTPDYYFVLGRRT